MPKKIKEDQKDYRKVISGKFRKDLGKLIDSGGFTRLRPDGKGRIIVPAPKINIPHFQYGSGGSGNGQGVGRGPGKKGQVIGREPGEGEGQAGNDSSEYINVAVELDDFLAFMEHQLHLPAMKPKPSQTFEEVKKRWNNLSKVGPRSLRHVRQTLRQAMKRLASTGELDKLYQVLGSNIPVPMIEVINDDFRYRQYTEHRIPTSDAVILFARDGSGSMDNTRCEIVSDMAWWVQCWLSRFYKKVQKAYFIHDAEAQEVDEKSFYALRMGGGTNVSSVFKKMAETFENRFPPSKYNIYVMYFSDGDNYESDNETLISVMEQHFSKDVVNLLGYTQVLTFNYRSSLKEIFDQRFKDKSKINLVSASIGAENSSGYGYGYSSPALSDEERDKAILEAIKTILGTEQKTLDV